MSAVSTEPNWEFTLQEARLNGGSVEPLDYQELQDWAYIGKRLVPLKGYFDIVCEHPKSRKSPPESSSGAFQPTHSVRTCPNRSVKASHQPDSAWARKGKLSSIR